MVAFSAIVIFAGSTLMAYTSSHVVAERVIDQRADQLGAGGQLRMSGGSTSS